MFRGRLRTLGIALAVAVGVVTAPGSAAAAGTAKVGTAPVGTAAAAPTPISATGFTLSADYATHDAVNAELDALLPNVDVDTVMTNANLDRQPLCHPTAPTGPVTGFCWATEDDTNCHNVPQGVTTTRDATAGEYDGHQLVVASWYYREVCTTDAPNLRSRITLVDWDADHPNKYRKILLVEATTTPDGPSFTDIGIHAGGISWYGHYLYVADTGSGMRVFDMRKIWEVDTTGTGIGRQPDGSYQAHAYRYVLPQTGMITDVGSTQLRWSAIGLDRAQPSLVMGEFAETDSHAVRFPLDPATQRLVVDGDGLVQATQALSVPYEHVQGVVSHNGRWWFASSSDKLLYYWASGVTATSHSWVSWCEGLSYWEDPVNPDLLWTLRENTGDRNVFSVEQSLYSA